MTRRKTHGTFPCLRYPSPVTRIFIIALLIVLLPLRGWTAERMAEHMAATAMPADCPMMMQAGSPDQASTDDGEAATPADRTCQLCMSLAAPETATVQAVSPAPQTVAVQPADRFASADLPRAAKPPIS